MAPGVLYLSRVPPGMTPGVLRELLHSTGEIERIYLRPESHDARKVRKKMGGSYKGYFIDGWIEYADKRMAKRAVALLNTRPIGIGRRGSRFEGDLWNLKYLKGFKWEDLSASATVARRMRVKRVRGEVAKAKNEKVFWEEKMDTMARIEGMKRNRGSATWEDREDQKRIKFKQNKVVLDDEEKYGALSESDQAKSVSKEVARVLFDKGGT